MAEEIRLSIDVGTTNIKGALIRGQDVLMTRSVSAPHSQSGEIDPTALLRAVDQVITALSQEDTPDQIVITTAMHSLLLADHNGSFLTPIYTWEAALGDEALARLSPSARQEQYLATGTPMHRMNVSVKLAALKQRTLWEEGIQVWSLKDLLLYHLTGEWVIDQACASASGLVAIQSGQWASRLLQTLTLPVNALPRIVPMRAQFPYHPTALAQQAANGLPTFLGKTVTVVGGTADGAAANGCFSDLTAALVISVGTSHAVRYLSATPQCAVEFQNFAYYLAPQHYLVGLPSNNGGNVLVWLQQQFQCDFSVMADLLSDGPLPEVIFLPYLNGERSPLWRASATGGWFGVTQATTPSELVLSGVLGMLCNIRMNYERLVALGGRRPVGLTGEFTKSKPLVQCLANLLGTPLALPTIPHAETFGALKLLGLSQQEMTYQTYEPDPQSSQALERYYQRFRSQLAKG